MIGGIEETSASFEARSAPRSYPTICDMSRLEIPQRSTSRCDIALQLHDPHSEGRLAIHIRRREFIGTVRGAMAWPLAARAQQSVIPVVGFVSSRSLDGS